MMADMYSPAWFASFAETVPAAFTQSDLDGIVALLPGDQDARVLDVGCGVGRIAGPLAARGYTVTGLDISVTALLRARHIAPGPRYIALDQRHIGRLRWSFDAALLLWNSIGFAGRGTDLETMRGLAAAVRPGGSVVLDLYHPEWLRRNEKSGERDERGPAVRRWIDNGRCYHEIRYSDGTVDDIQFDVYHPDEMRDLCQRAGFEAGSAMVRWDPTSPPDGEAPRYQMAVARP